MSGSREELLSLETRLLPDRSQALDDSPFDLVLFISPQLSFFLFVTRISNGFSFRVPI